MRVKGRKKSLFSQENRLGWGMFGGIWGREVGVKRIKKAPTERADNPIGGCGM